MFARATASIVVAGLLLGGCGGADPDPIVVGAEPSATVDVPTPPPDPSEPGVDDTYHPELSEFLARWKRGEAEVGPPPPTSVHQAIEYSTVVLLAEIQDVVGDGVEETETGYGNMIRAKLVLNPIKVLKGQLQPELDKVEVGFVTSASSEDPDPVATMRKKLPISGQAIWFLRWAASRGPSMMGPRSSEPQPFEHKIYLWTHRSTIFVQGPDGVEAPTTPPGSVDDAFGLNSVAAEARNHPKLSQLASQIARSGSFTQRATSTPGGFESPAP